jgi:hypothetical protein
VVLGIHAPETEAEHDIEKLRAKVVANGLAYPVAIDNRQHTWRAWANKMWPSVYLIDKRGHVRYWWYGELNWEGAKGEQYLRQRIEELLAEEAP